MRHKAATQHLGRSPNARKALIRALVNSLVEHGRITTTVAKAKELRRYADHMVTLAKKNTLASRRQAIAELMISYNPLTPKEARKAKGGSLDGYNTDRKVIGKLFTELRSRFAERNGGYTRIIKNDFRIGDNAPSCFIEFLSA